MPFVHSLQAITRAGYDASADWHDGSTYRDDAATDWYDGYAGAGNAWNDVPDDRVQPDDVPKSNRVWVPIDSCCERGKTKGRDCKQCVLCKN